MAYILALSLFLRLILINQSLWLDESIQALALMGKMGPILKYALADFQPPLYHLVGYLTTQVFGYSEVALRLPSLVAGILTVYFVVRLGELLDSKKTGIIAGLLAATNPLLIYYSQEGRTYAMTTFLVTASFYYFIKLLQDKNPSIRSFVLYALYTVLTIWTSYLSWFVLLAQGLYVLFKKRYDILLIQVGAGLTLLAWLPSFISSLGIGQSTRTGSPEWGQVVGGLSWKSLPLTWVKFVIGRIGFDHKLVYGLIVAVVGIFHLLALRLVQYKKKLILLVWLVPPIALGILTASFIPVYQYFRVMFVLPAYLLLLALGLSTLKSKRLLFVILTLQLGFLGYYWSHERYHHEDWRELVLDLPQSAVVAMPSRAQSAPLRYYGWDKVVLEPSHEEIIGDSVYYVRYVEDLFDSGRLGQANLERSGYTILNQKIYPGIQLDIYQKTAQPL